MVTHIKSLRSVSRAAAAILLLAGLAGCGGMFGSVDGSGLGGRPGATNPEVRSVSASQATLPLTGGTVTFFADVTDDGTLARVWAEISRPGATPVTVDLARTTGITYSATWTAPAADPTETGPIIYTVRIHARDNLGNVTTSNVFAITLQSEAVADTEAPAISGQAVNPTTLPFTGGQVTFSANVSDPGGVARVWVEVTKPDGSTESVDLTHGTDASYSGTWNVPMKSPTGGAAATYSVRFRAQDAAGNAGATDPVTFTVQPDTEAPVVAGTAVNPAVLRFPGGDVTITANVTDPGGVASVTAEVTRADGGQESVAMTNTTGATYSGTWRAPANTRSDDQALVHSVRVRGQDAAGNTSTGDAVTVTVHSASAPPVQPNP
ncbi:MAG: Ig-like domain repeat protein [Armatimonadetes bacterium]|nr:Ig-like domain repeat protein [Armatimonadota bacterium]